MDSLKGRIWLLGDDIDTDIIIPTDYLALKTIDEMKAYAFSPLRPTLAAAIQPGDILVAGKNFGCGSSREQAPEILKALGLGCIIARSFARIFFRNAINNGLLLLEQDALCSMVREGDELEVTVGQCATYQGTAYPLHAIPENLMEIIRAGGLVAAMQKRNSVK